MYKLLYLTTYVLEKNMEVLVLTTFGVLCFVAVLVKQISNSNGDTNETKNEGIEDFSDEAKFKKLKRKYFAAYFLALFGDWLQGPYVYQVWYVSVD